MQVGHCVPALGYDPSAPDNSKSQRMDLGKRHRSTGQNLDDEGLEVNTGRVLHLSKKGKCGLFSNRTCRKPADKAPTGVDTTSTAVGSGEDILMIPSVQGGCDQHPQEPNVQRGSTTTAQEEEKVYSVDDNTLETTEINPFKFDIPKRLNLKYRPFLEATSEDFARGTLHVLKCKLCPGADFSTWDDFVRHCKTTEAHPLKIVFCDRCGDFFARCDSLSRHAKNPPPECLGVALREAEDKRNETRRRHEEFKKHLGHYLETPGGIWTPFSQIIKEKYPDSSKRGSRQRSRLQTPKSSSP